MKKAISLLLTAALSLALVACGGGASSSAPASTPASEPASSVAESTPASEPAGETYNIGILQLMPHAALDQATQGFMDAVTEALGEDAVNFDVQVGTASDSAVLATMANTFVSNDVDLIMANATAALQAAVAATGDIPILGTSITDYATALEIENWTGTVGDTGTIMNVAGATDLAPLDQQAQMLADLFPVADYPKVGLLYCTGEPNSVYQIENVEKYLTDMGYTCERFGYSEPVDLAGVTQNAADNSDVIYIPTDNNIANLTGTVDNVLVPAGVPVIAGEEGICKGCGVATLSISYYDMGHMAGEQAVQILTEGADVSTMPIVSVPADTLTKEYVPDRLAAINLELDGLDDYTAIEMAAAE